MAIDPQIRAALASAPPGPDPDDVQGLRSYYADSFHRLAPRSIDGAETIMISDRRVPGLPGRPDVPVRIYRPPHADLAPGILYLHGGGFVAGDLDTFAHTSCLQLAIATTAIVVSVGYRLAPEHPHPAAVDDSYAVLQWIATNAAELGIDPRRLATVGTSAGGTIAAATAQMSRDHNGPSLALQLLLFAPLDNRSAAAQNPHLQPMWRHYLDNLGPTSRPYAVPGRTEDLTNLPPAYLLTGELDPFRDEGIAYAQRLLTANVTVELHVLRGATHCFDQLAPDSTIARHTRYEYHHALRTQLAQTAT